MVFNKLIIMASKVWCDYICYCAYTITIKLITLSSHTHACMHDVEKLLHCIEQISQCMQILRPLYAVVEFIKGLLFFSVCDINVQGFNIEGYMVNARVSVVHSCFSIATLQH